MERTMTRHDDTIARLTGLFARTEVVRLVGGLMAMRLAVALAK
jgi:hypothetical protein